MVVTTDNGILNDYKKKRSGSLKNPLLERESIPQMQMKQVESECARPTLVQHTRNALLEKLTKGSNVGRSSYSCLDLKRNLTRKDVSTRLKTSTVPTKRTFIPNPMLDGKKNGDFGQLTKNKLLTQTHRPVLRTVNTLLAPSFSMRTSTLVETAPTVRSPGQETVLPPVPQEKPLSRDDVKLISDLVGGSEVNFPSPDLMKQTTKIVKSQLSVLKEKLISVTCSSLLNNPVWFSEKDHTRSTIVGLCKEIALSDPEFVLKVALYCRAELNIRTTCNLLVAVASIVPECRPYLKKYFKKAVVLPSDWIQIAEFYQSLNDPDGKISTNNLPTALRKIMVAKFPDFDEYQLAKYNKDKSKKAKRKEKTQKKPESSEKKDEAPKLYVPSYTLKYLIRKLHIVKPAYPVMCILGKKYPVSMEEFYKCGLEGTWDSALSQKRMKLQVPETWETQVSAKGNLAKTWESLLDHRKLPFMAMLRNLRNMIQAGISEKHHQQVIKTLTNEKAVSRSRQFPFRFFSAYEALEDLEKELAKQKMYKQHGVKYFLTKHQQHQNKRKFGDTTPKSDEEKKIDVIRRAVARKYASAFRYDEDMIDRYRKALNKCVKIATVNNVSPITGHTVVLCEASAGMFEKNCTTSKGLGPSRTIGDVGILLGLMCAYSCEACTFIIYSDSAYKVVELEKGGILENLKRIVAFAKLAFVWHEHSKSLPEKFLCKLLTERGRMDNLVVLHSQMKDREDVLLSHFLRGYKSEVNSSLMCYKVDLGGKKTSVSNESDVVTFSGYSDQILKFIALGNAEAQIKHVETVDVRLNLAELKNNDDIFDSLPPVVSKPIKPWKTVRVFISSTIKDMNNERDALVSWIFPRIREWAENMKIRVLETDLRWGISGEDTRFGRNISICLEEVRKCDIFIGLLGDRYGWVPRDYGFPDDESDWLEDYPKSRSITELEIAQAAFRQELENKICLFYIRDSSEMKSSIPKSAKPLFFEQDSKKSSRLKQLKSRVLESGHYVGNAYAPKFDRIEDGEVKLSGLEDFEAMVENDLRHKLKEIADMDFGTQTESSERKQVSYQQDFVGRNSLMSAIMRKIKALDGQNSVLAIVGGIGSGKTSIIANIHDRLPYGSSIIANHSELQNWQIASNALRCICKALSDACQLDFNIDNESASLFGMFKKLLDHFRRIKSTAGSTVHILLDGLDHFDSFDWITKISKEKVTLIVSCNEGGNAYKALKHMDCVTFIPIPELTISDKRDIVRCALGKHSKKLDESHFNNQLQVLMSKKGSVNPMYLTNICDVIRVSETFESLGETLKVIPHDMVGSLKWQLEQVESKFSKYPYLIPAIIGILHCCDKWMILDDDLYEVISCWFSAGDNDIPKVVVFNAINSLKSFISWSQTHQGRAVMLKHSIYQKVLFEKYLAKGELVQKCHLLLAGFYMKKIWDSTKHDGVDSYLLVDCLKRLPTHLSQSGQRQDIENLLSAIEFVTLKCKLGVGASLLEDFELLKEKAGIISKRMKSEESPKPWLQMERFVKSTLDIITKFPNMVYQEAINQEYGSHPRCDALTKLDYHTQSNMVVMESGIHDQTSHSVVQTYRNSKLGDEHTCVTVLGTGRYFAAGTLSGKVKLIEKSTGNSIDYLGHCNSVTAVCFVKTTILVSAASDGTMLAWDFKAGHKIADLKLHGNAVTSIAVRPTSQGNSMPIFASASHDRSIGIWGATKYRLVKQVMTGSPVNCMDFHPHGARVATGLWDASIQIWDLHTHKRVAVIRHHSKAVTALRFSACGTYVASCSKYEAVVRLWTSDTGTAIGNFGEAYLQSPESVLFSADGKYLISGGAGANEDTAQIAVWRSRLGKESMRYNVDSKQDRDNIVCCKYNYDKSTIAVGFHEGILSMYDSRLPYPIYSEKIHESAISCVAWGPSAEEKTTGDIFHSLFSLDSNPTTELELVITGSYDSTLKAVDVSSKAVVAIFEGHTGPVLACGCAGKWLASGSEDFSVMLWNLENITLQMADSNDNNDRADVVNVSHSKSAREHEGAVTCLAFNTDGNLLLSGGKDGKLCYWDVVSDDQMRNVNIISSGARKKNISPILTIHQAHKDWITCCAWHDLDDTVVTGSNDSTLKIWKSPPSSGSVKEDSYDTPLRILTGHLSGVTSVMYKMGCVVSTGGEDCTVKVWSSKGTLITSVDTQSRTNCCDVNFIQHSSIEDDEDDDNSENPVEDRNVDWATQVDAEEWNDEHNKQKLGANNSKRANCASRMQMQNFDVLCAGNDASLVTWKPLTGQQIHILGEHAKSVVSLEVCGDGHILSQASTGMIKAWDLGVSSTVTRQIGEVTGVATVDGGLVTTCSAGNVYLWEITDDNRLSLQYQAKLHDRCVTDLCKLRKNVFATSSYDRKQVVWCVEGVCPDYANRTRKIVVIDTYNYTHPHQDVDTSRAPREYYQIAFGGAVPSYCDIVTEDSSNVLKLGKFFYVEDCKVDAVCSDYRSVIDEYGLGDSRHVCDSRGSEVSVENVELDMDDLISCFVHAADDQKPGKVLLLGSNHGYLYHTGSGSKMKIHDNKVTSILDGGRHFITTSRDSTIKIWERGSWKQIGQYYNSSPITNACVVTERIIAFGDSSGVVRTVILHF